MRSLLLVAGVMMLALAWGMGTYYGMSNIGTWVLVSFLTLVAGALTLRGLFTSRRRGRRDR